LREGSPFRSSRPTLRLPGLAESPNATIGRPARKCPTWASRFSLVTLRASTPVGFEAAEHWTRLAIVPGLELHVQAGFVLGETIIEHLTAALEYVSARPPRRRRSIGKSMPDRIDNDQTHPTAEALIADLNEENLA